MTRCEQKTFKHYIEIPVTVSYTYHPSEPSTPTDISVDEIVVGDVLISEVEALDWCWDHHQGKGYFEDVPF